MSDKKRSTPPSEKDRVRKNQIREDLQDGDKGKDLSYLNEMPQMAGYEGVKAGLPPPKDEGKTDESKRNERVTAIN